MRHCNDQIKTKKCTWHAISEADISIRLRLKCDGTRAETRFRLSGNGRVHLNRRGCQFSRLPAAEMCASGVVMLDTPCSETVWSVLANHSIRQFLLYFPSRVSPCAIKFQLDSTVEQDKQRKECNTVQCSCNDHIFGYTNKQLHPISLEQTLLWRLNCAGENKTYKMLSDIFAKF